MPDFGPYTRRELDRTLHEIGQAIHTVVGELDVVAWRTSEPVPFAERRSGEEIRPRRGDSWGGLFDCAWFRFRGRIPAAAAGRPVVLLLDVSGEMCVVDEQGAPMRGLTNRASHYDYSLGRPGKRVLPITTCAQGGEPVEVWADAGCNDLFGNLHENGALKEACIAICHEEIRALYYDYEVLLDLLKVLPEDSPRCQQVLTALNDARWQLAPAITEESARAARRALQPMLAQRGGDPSLCISAIGHAHIDLAWLWPIRETVRKGARTLATVLANMERYPGYVFGASQPQLFQWMKDMYPALYDEVKRRVLEGRFEPQGAMWVEADTNIPGGEALVRQLLYGKRFFRQEFGVEIRHLWLPDVFGYSAALPQILKRAGVDYFMTQKISWNQVNRFPHHSFHWQGIDGTRVLAHMLPEETYNSPALPRSLAKIERNYQDKGVSGHALLLYGIGDGGGGPGEEHIERLLRLGNLAGLPPVVQEPAAAFFEKWRTDAERFPTWVGELYLERHAGTLTTQARSKRHNRRLEQALRELEWMAILAGGDYPSTRLEAIWREVLLYQFHDILPGSSIKRVYDESLARYAALLDEVEGLSGKYQERLAREVDTSGLQAPALLLNPLSWERTAWVEQDGRWQRVTVPPLGYRAVDLAVGEVPPAVTASAARLENDLLRVEFAQDGSIASVYDKEARREAIAPGERANRLAVYHDAGDAWDFSLDYRRQAPECMRLAASEPRVEGPRAILRQTYRYRHSELVQEIVLEAGSRRLDFSSRLCWREAGTMLRTSFPVAIHAEEATYEIQFGSLRRPTHTNTTWDLARDEVAAHKYADLSQGDYGVALLNDCKYGHRIKGHVIDLNLLRSVPYPGPRLVRDEEVAPGEPHDGYTDQAEHTFRYALYPHRGDHVAGGVARAGYELNHPLRRVQATPHAGPRPPAGSLLTVAAPQVIVEAVKRAEDDGAIIVRLYEASHAAVRTVVRLGFDVGAVEEADLMERPIRALAVEGNRVELEFAPFEIKTLRLTRR